MQRWHPLPAAVYSFVEQTAASVLLESAPSRGFPSHSRLFVAPSRVLSPRSAAELDEMFAQIERAAEASQYAAGYLTYECGDCFEPAARMRRPTQDAPLAWFGIYDRCFVFDHETGSWLEGQPNGLAALHALAGPGASVAELELGLSQEAYADRIAAIHEAIRAGDVYQLNFTFPLRFRTEAGAAALYAGLRERQAVEYGAFVHGEPGRQILSFSPELFFQADHSQGSRRITTRPMKGTARRGRTTAEDRGIAAWLAQDEKNRSENLMIVDLLRSDLGRLCEFGSIKVDDLFAVERHPTLWQMTSTVSGVLRSGVKIREVLQALFPSGSVTGAPKIRAMQLITQLEEEPRGVYTGAIGFCSREKSVFNVAIRTVELNGQQARIGIGSGIVIDSTAAEEYRECRLKAEFLTRAQPEFELLESMLWDNGYPFLEMHLDRLEDSADYFDFEFNRSVVRHELTQEATKFPRTEKCKVRLLLIRSGSVRIEHQPIPSTAAELVRVCISEKRIDSADKFYFHKTTHRPLYTLALGAAQQMGFADVLFLNGTGEVTETALGNIFVERNRRWFTPPPDCGLLAGIYRRHLLETRPEIEQRILTLEDVKAADCVYVTNAVRGLRRAVIDFATYVSSQHHP